MIFFSRITRKLFKQQIRREAKFFIGRRFEKTSNANRNVNENNKTNSFNKLMGRRLIPT